MGCCHGNVHVSGIGIVECRTCCCMGRHSSESGAVRARGVRRRAPVGSVLNTSTACCKLFGCTPGPTRNGAAKRASRYESTVEATYISYVHTLWAGHRGGLPRFTSDLKVSAVSNAAS